MILRIDDIIAASSETPDLGGAGPEMY